MFDELTVPSHELEALRGRVRAMEHAWPDVQGWIRDDETATRIVALSPYLSVDPGHRLVTYRYCCGGNGQGFTFAVPVAAEVLGTEQLYETDFGKWAPREALWHLMAGVRLDGTLRSYVDASLINRELGELGARWHYQSWATHTLLDRAPEVDGLVVTRYGDEGTVPLDDERWGWEDAELLPFDDDALPRVRRTDEGFIEVEFWTFSELGQVMAQQHVDTYLPDRLAQPMRIESLVSVTGRRGFRF